jgi:hypothetical protein
VFEPLQRKARKTDKVKEMSPYKMILVVGACMLHPAAPAAQRSSRTYALDAIDGHSLPAVWNVSAGDTSWAHWGRVVLTPDGKASVVEFSTHTYHGAAAGGGTNTVHAMYRVYGDSIEIGSLRSCTAPCFEGQFGVISDSTLTLTPRTNPGRAWPIYRYHIVRGR